MSSYIVRIELHGANADYRKLHTWMQAASFQTCIDASDGSSYQLPTATYVIESTRTTEDLRDWLVTNLPACGSNPAPWILVVKSAGAAWRMGNQVRQAA